MGISIRHFRITSGTLWAFVTGPKDTVRILSNNHVLADENQGVKGDAILQPGAIDGGLRRHDRVGGLDRFVRLKPTATNAIDVALATTTVWTRGRRPPWHPGEVAASQPRTRGHLVEKWGTATGHHGPRDRVRAGQRRGRLRDGQPALRRAGRMGAGSRTVQRGWRQRLADPDRR
jgi:hypothetical protein